MKEEVRKRGLGLDPLWVPAISSDDPIRIWDPLEFDSREPQLSVRSTKYGTPYVVVYHFTVVKIGHGLLTKFGLW